MQEAKTQVRSEVEIEKIVRNVAAIMSFEDMGLTEQNKEDMRRMLRGEVSADDVIAEIEKRHGLTKRALRD